MKSSLTLFVAASCALSAWSQSASAPKPAAPAEPAASTTASPASSTESGPEAIAAKEPNKVVATINGQPITAKQAYDLLKLIPADQRATAGSLESVFERLYTIKALAGEAEKQHLDQEPSIKSQIELSRDNVLAQAYISKLTGPQTNAPVDARQYYDSHKGEFDTAKLSGIAIAFNPPGTPANPNGPNRTEQEAQAKADDVEKKLKAGADIATLARTESDDQRSAAQAGSLGTLTSAQPGIPPQIKDVVFGKLQPGQVSEPIRLPNAFYIIKLDSRSQQPYEEVRSSIEQKLRGDKNQAVIKQELDKYKVKVEDPAFFASSKTPSLGTATRNGSGSASATQSTVKK